MNRELISVIDELGRQKGIEKSRVLGSFTFETSNTFAGVGSRGLVPP